MGRPRRGQEGDLPGSSRLSRDSADLHPPIEADDAAEAADAVEQAVAAGADIVNLSFAGYDVSGNAAIRAGVEAAQEAARDDGREVALVAAAGNENQDAKRFVPAALDGVTGVGALDAAKVAQLREQGAQIVVVSLHWGTEEKTQPTSSQAAYARFCIDAGADVVYGHHAHILQSVQFYKGKPIFYSTGNFTFGTMSHVDPDTGIFQLTYEVVDGEPVLRRFSVVPCRTQGSGDYRPYILTDESECREMRQKLVHKSRIKNMTTVTDFFVENGYMDFADGVAVGE